MQTVEEYGIEVSGIVRNDRPCIICTAVSSKPGAPRIRIELADIASIGAGNKTGARLSVCGSILLEAELPSRWPTWLTHFLKNHGVRDFHPNVRLFGQGADNHDYRCDDVLKERHMEIPFAVLKTMFELMKAELPPLGINSMPRCAPVSSPHVMASEPA